MSRSVKPAYLHVFFFLLGIFAARLPGTVAQVTGHYAFFDPIIDIQGMLDEQYVEDPDWEALQRGAIDGMLEALDDPYAQYIPPALQKDFEKAMTGEFVGIGAEVTMSNPENEAYLEIASPLEDSPAYNAGIMAGDLITHIEEESTLPLTVNDCIDRLTGKPGTEVTITVERNGVTLDPITLTRRQIVVKAVRGLVRDKESGRYDYVIDAERRIAYVRLTQFTPSSGDELEEVIRQVAGTSGAPGGLILDVRGNPGGIMDAALQIADLFLEDGVIMSERGRSGDDNVHRARSKGTLPDFPVVVLINGASASASEIVAGALQDHGRAKVLGMRSFGKGLVQTVRGIPHSRGGQVKFTAQRYYLPSGRLIQREDDSETWGVDPDPGFYIPLGEEENLERFLRRRELDVLRSEEQADEDLKRFEPTNLDDPAQVEEQLKDPQLAAALRAVQTRLDTGEWEAVGAEEPVHEQVALSELPRLQKTRERLLREFTRLDRRIDALADAAAGRETPKRDFDLWPDEQQITDGRVEVYDRDGKVIARLEITGPDLERWLMDADVRPIEEQKGDEAVEATPDTAPAPSDDSE